ncbi:MAG TPA: hypothetical protein PLK37_01520 [Terricaulis sp.]|nr:hypothetical protein [Terricaulis sp.]
MTFYKFAVGLVLAIAMVSVLALSALVFSARDFQYGLAQVAPSTNGLLSFEKLRETDQRVAALEAESAAPRGELAEVEQAIAAIDGRIASAEAAANETRAAIVGGVAALEQRADAAAPASTDLSVAALSQRVSAAAAQPGVSSADQQALAALTTQTEQLAQQEEALEAADAERAALVARQRTIGGQVAESNRAIFALQQNVVPYEVYGRVRGEAAALSNLSPWGVSAFLAQGHPALLSTILVLLMGGLGSLLYLFPAYLNRAVPVTMAEVVVRLIFGACAAFALYMLANAAIAGFAFGSGAETAASSSALNPFTVSLIGIVAGVLSEDIAKWIQDRGRGMFQQGGVATSPVATGAVAAAAADDGSTHAGGGLVNNQAIS